MADAKKETKTVAKAPAAEQAQKKDETTGVTRRLAKTAAASNTSVAAVAEKEGAKAEKKAATKKTAAKKTTAKTAAAPKAEKAPAKKTVAKKTTAKKETAVKTGDVSANVVLQHYGKDTNINEIIENVKKSYVADGHKATSIKSLNVYLKPEDGFAYFVINESYAGKVDLF